MSKKKLAFYDAFRQKPDEPTEFPADSVSSESSSSSSKNLSGYSPYAPGEELSVRPRPKHIPTSHHAAGSQKIEVRAKGSSLPPGVAQKYQTPNVNHSYFPNNPQPKTNTNVYKAPEVSSPQPPKPTFEQNRNIPLPPEESEINIEVKPKALQYESEKVVPVAKPISKQSATMPYLEPEDLETQNIQIPSPKKSPSIPAKQVISEVQPNEEVLYTVTVPKAILALIGLLFLMVLSFYIGFSFQKENNGAMATNKVSKPPVSESVREIESFSTGSKLAQPIEPPPKVEPEKPKPPVVNSTKRVIIRAVIVESVDRAKALAEKLESSGYSPTEIKQTRKGVLISIGPFETTAEASKVLKSLKYKSFNGLKYFESAYLDNN